MRRRARNDLSALVNRLTLVPNTHVVTMLRMRVTRMTKSRVFQRERRYALGEKRNPSAMILIAASTTKRPQMPISTRVYQLNASSPCSSM